MSAWLFDLGNTRLKCAPLSIDADGTHRIGAVQALPHAALDAARDGFAAALAGVLPERLEAAYVASVADERLRVALLEALAARCRRISLARTQHRAGGVTIAYAQPHKLGVDRFLAMLGAHAQGSGATLLCGVGTALTVDLLDADGRHLGGRIAPSPALMRAALQQRAAQLPAEGGDYLEFAADTEDALASGCLGAAVALVERSVAQAAMRLGSTPRLLLHGGGAKALLPLLPAAGFAPTLVLEGLARWAAAGRS